MAAQKDDLVPANPDIDDLTLIQGIGPTFSSALYRIGICRFLQLAQYTPETLSEALTQEAGSKVTPGRIGAEDWIGQARMRAGNANHKRVSEPEDQEPEHQLKSVNAPPWRQHAGFSLFFDYLIDKEDAQVWQTRVYHDESGQERVLSGYVPSLWVDWILRRAKLPPITGPALGQDRRPSEASSELTGATPASVSAQPTEIVVEICEVQVSQPLTSYSTHKRELSVDVHFRVSSAGVMPPGPGRISAQVQAYLVDLESGESCLAASGHAQLDPEGLEHTAQVRFPMPQVGRYQLYSLVLLLVPGARVNVFHGPIINILPPV
jgi:hypothetical protein